MVNHTATIDLGTPLPITATIRLEHVRARKEPISHPTSNGHAVLRRGEQEEENTATHNQAEGPQGQIAAALKERDHE
jgi:hypothetical protein